MLDKRFKLVVGKVVMAADDTEYSFLVPEGATQVRFRADAAFRYHSESGKVAGGDGLPVTADVTERFDNMALFKGSIYVAHTAGVSTDLWYSYGVPITR